MPTASEVAKLLEDTANAITPHNWLKEDYYTGYGDKYRVGVEDKAILDFMHKRSGRACAIGRLCILYIDRFPLPSETVHRRGGPISRIEKVLDKFVSIEDLIEENDRRDAKGIKKYLRQLAKEVRKNASS